jgi:membrane peptidoglycan carboxypeptidase
MLCSVVERGTGQNAKLPGIRIAGKTGTSQQLVGMEYSKQAYNASFVGYFPANAPKVALLILLDKPKGNYHGGAVAAPIFANITKRWLAVSDDFPPKLSKDKSSNVSPADYVYVPDISGLFLSDAIAIVKNFGLKIDCQTDSNLVVIAQSPRAGTIIRRDQSISVKTKDKTAKPQSPKKGSPDDRINVVGLSARRGLVLLHSSGVRTRIIGSGIIAEQVWSTEKNGETLVTLICKTE